MKNVKLNFNLAKYFIKKNFSFKFSNMNKDVGPIKTKVSFGEVNEKMKFIITTFTKEHKIHESDQKYVAQNLINFREIKNSELPILAEILSYSLNDSLKNTNYFLKKSEEKNDKNLMKVPRTNFNIYQSFREVLNFKLKGDSLCLEDISSVYKSLKKQQNPDSKMFYILSDCLEVLIEKIKKSKTEKYSIGFLENNVENLDSLILLPFGKKKIGDLVNFILKKSVTNKKTEHVGLSAKFTKFLSTFYYEYDKEVFLKFIILNQKLPTIPSENSSDESSNKINSFNTIIFSIKDVFTTNFSENKNLSQKELNVIDNKLTNEVSILNKSKNYEKINLLYRELLISSSSKSSFSKIKLLSKFAENSNIILNEFYENHLSQDQNTFKPNYANVRNILEFYSKFYNDFKHYLFTEDETLKNIFTNYHNTYEKYLALFNNLEINWTKIDKSEQQIIYDVLNLLNNNASCNLVELNSQNFFIKNFNHKEILNNFENISFRLQSKQRTLYKIISIYLTLKNEDQKIAIIQNENLKILINMFLNSFQDNRDTDKYFLDLNSLLYNYILNDLKDEEMITKMIEKIFEIIKHFGFRQVRFLNRLSLVSKNLKVYHPKIYEKFRSKLEELEMTNESVEDLTKNLWWDKDYFYINKYKLSEVEEVIKNNPTVKKLKVNPSYDNLYFSDFLVNDDTWVEFLGPYHYENTSDVNDRSKIINKYEHKRKIITQRNSDIKFIYIPYTEVLKDLKNIDKYLI